MIAALFLLMIVIVAILAPVIAPHDAGEQRLANVFAPPAWEAGGSSAHLLGTDQLGRDLLSRMIFASRVSVVVALAAVGISLVIGTVIGLVSGYLGGRVDQFTMAVVDATMSFPGLLAIMAVAAVFGPGLWTIVIALSVRYWTTYARVVRGSVISLRETDFVAAARVIGGNRGHVMRNHLIPNVTSSLVALVPLELGRVMLAESTVSFLGFGVQPPTTSWGLLISQGRQFITSAPWLILFPGLILFLTIVSSNLLGSWLRLIVDPVQRGSLENH